MPRLLLASTLYCRTYKCYQPCIQTRVEEQSGGFCQLSVWISSQSHICGRLAEQQMPSVKVLPERAGQGNKARQGRAGQGMAQKQHKLGRAEQRALPSSTETAGQGRAVG